MRFWVGLRPRASNSELQGYGRRSVPRTVARIGDVRVGRGAFGLALSSVALGVDGLVSLRHHIIVLRGGDRTSRPQPAAPEFPQGRAGNWRLALGTWFDTCGREKGNHPFMTCLLRHLAVVAASRPHFQAVRSRESRLSVSPMFVVLALLHGYIGVRLLAPFGAVIQVLGAGLLAMCLWLLPNGFRTRGDRGAWSVLLPSSPIGFFSWLLVLTLVRDWASSCPPLRCHRKARVRGFVFRPSESWCSHQPSP